MYEAMFRKKFEDLRSFTHFADNNILDKSEKFTKVRSLYYVMNKNLKQLFFFFFMLFTSFMNERHHTLGTIATSKRSEQRAFVSETKTLHYDLRTVTASSLIHVVVLNMVEKKYPRNFVLGQLLMT